MKYSEGFAVIWVIILVVVVGVGAYYAGKTISDKKNITPVVYQEGSTATNEVVVPKKIPATSNTPKNDPVLTQTQATSLALSTWSNNCPDGDCSNISALVTKNTNGQYLVTMLFPQRDDSVKSIKKEALATYQNGTWVLSSETTTQSCQLNRGHQDFSIEPCK